MLNKVTIIALLFGAISAANLKTTLS
jgi:hypothetical protein